MDSLQYCGDVLLNFFIITRTQNIIDYIFYILLVVMGKITLFNVNLHKIIQITLLQIIVSNFNDVFSQSQSQNPPTKFLQFPPQDVSPIP